MIPLKRPMFRSGGPIKEGIMNGMQEPQAINTVGNNANRDAMGREKHGFFVPFMGLLGQGARMALRPIGKFAMRNVFGKPTVTTGAGGAKTIASNITGQTMKFQPTKFGSYLASDPLIGGGIKATKAIMNPANYGKLGTVAKFARSPSTLLSAAYLSDALPGGQPLFGSTNIFGQKFDPVTGNKISGDKPETPDKEPKFSRKDGKDGSNTTDGTSNVKTEKLDPKVFEDRKKYYYSLMGIDKMQKDAAYDSLIDASKIIQEEGGDLKGSIKSGNLQNRIIQAISGNLDKSADLKKQIDAAILKGEITKDIEQSKVPESLRVARSLGISDKEYKAKILGKEDVATTLSNYMMKQGALTPDVVAGALKTEGKDPLAVIGSDKIEDFKKKFGADKDEIDLLLTAEDLKPGFYVVGKRIVELDDKGKASFYY